MDPTAVAIVGVTVILAEGMVSLMKLLIKKIVKQNEDELEANKHSQIIHEIRQCKGLSDEQTQQFASLHDLHARYDSDGVPLWYVPRSWAETQREITEKLEGITKLQVKMLDIIERLERRIDKE